MEVNLNQDSVPESTWKKIQNKLEEADYLRLDVQGSKRIAAHEYRFSGRLVSLFNYVYYPEISVEDGYITGFSCECYHSRKSGKLCSHCEALYLRLAEWYNLSDAPFHDEILAAGFRGRFSTVPVRIREVIYGNGEWVGRCSLEEMRKAAQAVLMQGISSPVPCSGTYCGSLHAGLQDDIWTNSTVAELIRLYLESEQLSVQHRECLELKRLDCRLSVYYYRLLTYGATSIEALRVAMSQMRKYYLIELDKKLRGEQNQLEKEPDLDAYYALIQDNLPPIAGVRPGGVMTFTEADSGRVNPHALEDDSYIRNCQSCVVTFEARLRGYDVEVLPNTPGSVLEALSRATNAAWVSPVSGNRPNYIFDREADTPEKFIEFLERTVVLGDRYTIQFGWKGTLHSGHIINLDRNPEGALRFHDNQIDSIPEPDRIRYGLICEAVGYTAISNYLQRVRIEKGSYPLLLRIDHMDFNYPVVNCIMKGANHGTESH